MQWVFTTVWWWNGNGFKVLLSMFIKLKEHVTQCNSVAYVLWIFFGEQRTGFVNNHHNHHKYPLSNMWTSFIMHSCGTELTSKSNWILHLKVLSTSYQLCVYILFIIIIFWSHICIYICHTDKSPFWILHCVLPSSHVIYEKRCQHGIALNLHTH